jgi:predicted transposase/invertase (TIGR01784 family)
MSDLQNPHDRFFKELLAPPDTAAEFMSLYLPAEIASALDLSTLAVVKDSFVDERLREYFSDLLYRVKLKAGGEAFIYILLEHKSVPEPLVALQLLTYLVRIWEPQLRGGAKRLPLVFPVVFYHGAEAWQVSESFGALFDFGALAAAREYVPEFRYYLCDLSKVEELKGEARLKAGMATLKYVFSEELAAKLVEIFMALSQLPPPRRKEYTWTVLTYLLRGKGRVTAEQVAASLEQIFPKEGAALMQSIADTWIQQGQQQGLQQGFEQGAREAVVSYTLRLLRRLGPLPAESEELILRLPTERLEALGVASVDFSSADDLTAWLRDEAGRGEGR